MGIYTSVSGWQDQLSTKLSSYVTSENWSYNFETDVITIVPAAGTTVSLNLTDFGDAGGVVL